MAKSRAVVWGLALVGSLSSVLFGLFAGCGVPPTGVQGESLGFEVVYCRWGWDEGSGGAQPLASFGGWVIATDGELAAYWADQADPGCLEPASEVDLGEPPHIPEGKTALLIAPGGMLDGQFYRVTGVYDDSGDWTVAAILREKGGRNGSELNMGARVLGIILVEGPPPSAVVLRVEDQTGGPSDGKVWWSDGRAGQ